MRRFLPVLKQSVSAVLVVACVALGVLLHQEHRQETLLRQERLIAAHGSLVSTLNQDTLSLDDEFRALELCHTVQRELDALRDTQDSETQEYRVGLERFWDSAERWLSRELVAAHSDVPRGERITLTQKEQSVMRFIRKSCQRVYDGRNDKELAGPNALTKYLYHAVGAEFEATFHSFDRKDFFRAGDPLEAFFEV